MLTIQEFQKLYINNCKDHVKELWFRLENRKQEGVVQFYTFQQSNKETNIIDSRLTVTEEKVYNIIKTSCFKNKFCFCSVVILAILINRSIRTVKRCLKKLQSLGLIYSENRGNQPNRFHCIEKYKKSWEEVVHKVLESKNRTVEQIKSYKDKVINKASQWSHKASDKVKNGWSIINRDVNGMEGTTVAQDMQRYLLATNGRKKES